jgi:hypothetical protein
MADTRMREDKRVVVPGDALRLKSWDAAVKMESGESGEHLNKREEMLRLADQMPKADASFADRQAFCRQHFEAISIAIMTRDVALLRLYLNIASPTGGSICFAIKAGSPYVEALLLGSDLPTQDRSMLLTDQAVALALSESGAASIEIVRSDRMKTLKLLLVAYARVSDETKALMRGSDYEGGMGEVLGLYEEIDRSSAEGGWAEAFTAYEAAASSLQPQQAAAAAAVAGAAEEEKAPTFTK